MGFWKKYFGRPSSLEKPAETAVIERESFGRCLFERDPVRKTLKLTEGVSQRPFGRYQDLEIEIEVPEDRIDEVFQCLSRVYEGQEHFLGEFYEGIRSFCEEWEETDSKGNAVTLEMAERNGILFRIRVEESYKRRIVVRLDGMMFDDEGNELLGCHSVVAEIDGETGEVGYDLEG